jgi:lipoprotein NlpI
MTAISTASIRLIHNYDYFFRTRELNEKFCNDAVDATKVWFLMNSLYVICLVLCTVTDTPSQYVSRGMNAFRVGRIQQSLADFDQAVATDPRIEPYLWQRGISQYCMGAYQAGKRQFEIHKEVNPNDVENAAWHYLCVAKMDGRELAKKQLLPINTVHDTRVPMKEIYQYLAGKANEQDIMRAVERADSPQARMYAHLYLGLCADIDGERSAAQKHLEIASSQKLENSYMRDVAQVMLDRWRNSEEELNTQEDQLQKR